MYNEEKGRVMKKKALILLFALCGVFLALQGNVQNAEARIWLMDDKLQLTGYFKETMFIRTHIPRNEKMFHDSNVDMARTSFLIEGLYNLYEGEETNINLFGGFRYWYAKMPDLDEEFKEAIPHRMYSEYEHPRDDELFTELYVDFVRGPLQLRLGKQIVVWGETNLKRTADVINPIDLRHGSPGTEDWENIKIGLYMLRGWYQTDLPGQLLFEFLFIPGDFEVTHVPIEGTHYGPGADTVSFNPGKGYGIYHWVQNKARHDAPGWNLSNYEYGIRLRGYTWNIDWTVFYFNTISDVGVVDDIDRYNDFSLLYVSSAITSIATGSRINPRVPDYKVFDYKRYEVIGGTMQTIVDRLHGCELRLEWFYEIGNAYNKGEGSSTSSIYETTERDAVGFGMTWADRFTIPWFTHKFCDDKKMSLSFTVFYEKILNYDRDVIIMESGRGHRTGDSHASTFAWSLSQFFFHSKVMFMFTGSYIPHGKYFLCPILAYAPGDHWRIEAALPIYGYGSDSNKGMHDKDSVLIRLRYEF